MGHSVSMTTHASKPSRHGGHLIHVLAVHSTAFQRRTRMTWHVAQSRVGSARGRHAQRVHAVDLQPPLGRRPANHARQVCEVAAVLHPRTVVIFTHGVVSVACTPHAFGPHAGKYHSNVGEDACLDCDKGNLSSTLAQYPYYADGICRCSRKWHENEKSRTSLRPIPGCRGPSELQRLSEGKVQWWGE